MGGTSPQVTQIENLFTNRARQGQLKAVTNLENGSTLPSDQSHVTLALRCFIWFRQGLIRGPQGAAGEFLSGENGDFAPGPIAAFYGIGPPAGAGVGTTLGTVRDVYRLLWQSMEQIHWSFGTGEKFSITNMQTKYFPDGGGLSGDMGGTSDLIHWNNGTPDHTAILRLARAILLPPRQNVKCVAEMNPLPNGGNAAAFGTTVLGSGRDMLSITDNLNAPDGVGKCITFTFDGLFARDVQ